ncbi:MAG TPA: GAF domain-containing protein [Verrucomicrobiae bacterium]|jgi:signal transduction histidine kinase|nr:GAF domain-containing protein [Verrucomicrobiae bacterium]
MSEGDFNHLDFEELKRRYERLHLLYEVNNVIHSTLEPERALQLIITEAVRLLRASSGSVVLINPTNNFLEIEAAVGLPAESKTLRLKVGEGITGWVARMGKAARVGDVSADPRYIVAKDNVCSELAVPLEVGGEVRGVLNVDSERLNAFSPDDEQLLRDLAAQAAQVIQNTWLYEQLRQKARLFETLVKVSQTINSTLNLDDALNVITREACHLMGAKLCSLLMLDAAREWLELRASYGAGEAYINKPRLAVGESLLGTVVRRKKPLQVENVQLSARYQHIEVARQEGLVSLLSVPLLFGGKSIGTLSVYMPSLHSFSNEEIRILSALAEFSGIAIEKARLYERLVDIEDQLRQNEKLSAIGLLAAEVAHEIRNPLTVIKMLFHSLDLQFAPDDPRARDLEVMRARIDHLNKTVEQILSFARTADPSLASISLNAVIEDLALLIRHKLKNQGIKFVSDLHPELPSVLADAAQLSQAFLNLVLNSVEAMPHGGTLTIHTAPLRRGVEPMTHAVVELTDTGSGMSEEQQANAFRSLLHTTKKQGTGIGLAIVGKIIEAHHGQIEVKSRKGKGTTFRITLPLAAPQWSKA